MRVLLTLLLVLGAVGAAVATPLEEPLCDFETPEELARWQPRELTTLALTDRWASRGHFAAALTFQRGESSKERWTAAAVVGAPKGLPVGDLQDYEALLFTAHNPEPQPAEVRVVMRSAGGAAFEQTFLLPPGATQACTLPVAGMRDAIDVSHITAFSFLVRNPARTYAVYLDDLRLRFDLAVPARELAERARRLSREAARALGTLGRPVPPALAAEGTRLRSLETRAASLSEECARLARLEDAPEARRRLHALNEECLAAQAVLPRLRGLAFTRGGEFALAVESSMRKVFLGLDRFDSPFATDYALSAARNEYESFQALVVPLARPLAGVTWRLSPLRHPSGRALEGSVRVVGYVDCKQPSYPVEHTGWWPDPLLDFLTRVDQVPLGEVIPLWTTFHVPEDAPAGEYQGTLTVSAQGMAPRSLKISLRVWDFALPKQTHLRTALSWRALPNLYPAEKMAGMRRRYEDWMLREYHLNPGNIYAGPPDWDAARLRELISMGLNGICLGYLNAPTGKNFQPDAYWRTFDEQTKAIEEYLRVIDAAGARDRCYIYCFDERPEADREVVFETAEKLRRRWPDIKVMTTAYDSSFGLGRPNGGAVGIWVPLSWHFGGNAARIEEARKAGRDIWWYVCISPKHPYANWFVEYPAIEARLLMGAMTARYRPGGFLYYAVNRWPVNDKVITSGPRTDWNPASFESNNGDGSILCAGPNGPLATVRLENIRDGIEDYEYYLLLRKLLQERGESASAGEVPAQVVQSLTAYTHDPAVVQAERARVAGEILRLSHGK